MQVPPELKEDLLLIADKIEPYLLQAKEQADKIPEKAHELAGKIQPAAEQLGDKIEETAEKVHPLDNIASCLCPIMLPLLSLISATKEFCYVCLCMVTSHPK